MFHEVCADDKPNTTTECHGNIDKPFRNEPARLAFKAFSESVVKLGEERTVMTIIHLGVIMTATMECFKEFVSDFLRTHHEETRITDLDTQLKASRCSNGSGDVDTRANGLKKDKRVSKMEGGRISMDSAR